MSAPAAIAVFVSGGGTNLQALLDAFAAPPAAHVARVRLVVSDRPDAGALRRARDAGVPDVVVPVAGRPVDEVAADLLRALDAARIDIVALAGYLRLVPPAVVRRFHRRMLNVHPALLPAFGGPGFYGRRVHRAVIDAGCRVSGATVHFVDEAYDTGPILAQWPVPVRPGDTPEALTARVLAVEHALYPAALERLARDAVAGEVGEAGARGGAAFHLLDDSAPTRDEVRRALGLD